MDTSLLNRTWPEYAALPLRLILGGAFVAHGLQKILGGIEGTAGFFGSIGIPAPGLTAWAVALLETVGGLMLIAGAFVPIVSVLLILTMLGAMFTVHWQNGFFFMNQPPGIEVNLLYIAGLLALVVGGAGALSVDAMQRGRTVTASRM